MAAQMNPAQPAGVIHMGKRALDVFPAAAVASPVIPPCPRWSWTNSSRSASRVMRAESRSTALASPELYTGDELGLRAGCDQVQCALSRWLFRPHADQVRVRHYEFVDAVELAQDGLDLGPGRRALGVGGEHQQLRDLRQRVPEPLHGDRE